MSWDDATESTALRRAQRLAKRGKLMDTFLKTAKLLVEVEIDDRPPADGKCLVTPPQLQEQLVTFVQVSP